ncbi:MAG: rod shape-determining protein MreC [Lachnospiraceae bacterium]|nr:rod shape-determining protein MreC [Lachnospiraceae bacterium]
MRRRNRFSIEPKYILIFFVVLCSVLLIASFKYKETFSPIRAIVGDVITPMQKGINSVGSFFTIKTDIFVSKQELMKQNKELQNQLDNISYENRILQQEKYELSELRKLFELDEKYASYPKVAARVIDKDPGNWYNIFKIDKGSDDGLKVDMNVLAGDGSGGGLVGIITEVGHNWARVRAIVDDSSNVGAMILKTNENCMVSGNLKLKDEGLLEFSDLEKSNSKVTTGNEVVTSYLSDKYHEGILIGYIKELKTDSTFATRCGYITPAVNFDQIETVLVITELKEEMKPKPVD